MSKDALTVINERKSVRNFTGKAVSIAEINKILKAAMAAPAAMFMMPWEFIVVTNREKLKSLAEELPYAKMLVKAGTCIVVCAVPEEAAVNSEAFAIIDCACASENILLAAEALGLGAVWTAVYPNKLLMEFVRKELGIPKHVIPLNLIPIGHPVGDEKPRNKFDIHKIHWENWP